MAVENCAFAQRYLRVGQQAATPHASRATAFQPKADEQRRACFTRALSAVRPSGPRSPSWPEATGADSASNSIVRIEMIGLILGSRR